MLLPLKRTSIALLSCTALLVLGLPPIAAGLEYSFEDIYGPCGDTEMIPGPGTLNIGCLTITTTGDTTWNVGKDAGINPFDSDYIQFFSAGSGATIDFPTPIHCISFWAGHNMELDEDPTYEMIVNGLVTLTFTATQEEPVIVGVCFMSPTSQIRFQQVGGPTAVLGLDKVSYVPEGGQLAMFEDVFGPCPADGIVAGPAIGLVDGIQFTTPGMDSWNFGWNYSDPPGLGNPFDTDAYGFYANGGGAAMDFVEPVTAVSFRAGQWADAASGGVFDVIANGATVATFEANLWAPTFVNTCMAPTTHVEIVWTGAGGDGRVAIDDLEFVYWEAPELCPGDMNCDGIVNYSDIDPFVAALSCVGGDPSCWDPACPWLNGDCNGDGNVTYADIDAFVEEIGSECE